MAGAYDPMDGVTSKTTKEELMERLRKAGAAIRRGDRQRKAALQEVEDRIRAKGVQPQVELQQVIVTATEDEWKQAIEFLEEFDDLLPIPLQRLVVGGHALQGQIDAAG